MEKVNYIASYNSSFACIQTTTLQDSQICFTWWIWVCRLYRIIHSTHIDHYRTVLLAKRKSTNDVYAIKIIKKKVDPLFNEYRMLSRLHSRYTVTLFDAFETHSGLSLVMEYLPGGDLRSLLQLFGRLSEEWASFYTKECGLGLKFLQDKGIIHRDIKPENLIIDISGHVKIVVSTTLDIEVQCENLRILGWPWKRIKCARSGLKARFPTLDQKFTINQLVSVHISTINVILGRLRL